MKLNDKIYDVLKWIALIFLPAFAVFYGAVGPVKYGFSLVSLIDCWPSG